MQDERQQQPLVDEYGMDLESPLYGQVGALGDRYFDWVHTPLRKRTLAEQFDRPE